jgi:hypothetical protein
MRPVLSSTILTFAVTSVVAFSNRLIGKSSNDGASPASISQQNDVAIAKQPRLSLAPMMNSTNRHFRAIIRLISSQRLLYTEMVAVDELLSTRSSGIHQFFDESKIIPEGPSVL